MATPQIKMRPDQVKTEDDTSAPSAAESEAPAEDSISEEPPAIVDAPIDQSIDDITESIPDINTELSSEPVVENNNDTPMDSPINDDFAAGIEDTPSDSTEDFPPVTSEDSIVESVPDSDDLNQGQSDGGNDPFGDLASPIEDSEGDLTEKILQDLESQTKVSEDETPTEYVAPPDYEYPGRGLVYNCKALHWACVDGPSYKTCEQNASFQKSKGANPECYPFNIYETSKGCTSMQNRVVSSGAKTDFCKEF